MYIKPTPRVDARQDGKATAVGLLWVCIFILPIVLVVTVLSVSLVTTPPVEVIYAP